MHTNQADQLISSGPSHAHFIVEAKSLPENCSEYNQGDIPQCFAGDGLTQVISDVVSEAGGEAELGAGRGGEGAGAQEEAHERGDKVHDVTEVPGDWSPSP